MDANNYNSNLQTQNWNYWQAAQNTKVPQPNTPWMGQGQTTKQEPTITQTQPGNQFLTMPIFLARNVQSEMDILPNEIPMNGQIAIFVQNDLKTIYAKTWANGQYLTNVYQLLSPETEANQENNQNDTKLILERLNQLEETIKQQRPKPYYNRNHGNKKKPEKQGGTES